MGKITAQDLLPRAIGVSLINNNIFLFLRIPSQKTPLIIATSADGIKFDRFYKNPIFFDKKGIKKDFKVNTLRISKVEDDYILLYKKQYTKQKSISIAKSKDLILFENIGSLSDILESASVASEIKFKGKYVMYFGDEDIKVGFSKNLKRCEIEANPVLKPRNKYFDNMPLEVGDIFLTKQGILLIYYVKTPNREGESYAVGVALFDKTDPKKLIYRLAIPVWDQSISLKSKTIYPIGSIKFKNDLLIYFGIERKGVFVIKLTDFEKYLGLNNILSPVLKRVRNNPIVSPVSIHPWESKATFNAATIYEDGKVHILYRAIGESNTSVLGYASSKDGTNIDERLKYPVYVPRFEFECPGKTPLISYLSGGGYGGCEDPRLTKIDDTIYMTYVAYNGSDPPRVALTSIRVDDFLNKRWHWETPKIISQKGIVDKNACIFPEKINGKYVILHRVFPNILIDFVDDLDFEDEYLKGEYRICPRSDSWDSRKVGAGAPPIKINDGWLLVYHAVDDRNASQYKIGAMILDKNDPTKVNYWSNNPILEPSYWYENEGYKGGVCYPCGAVILNNELIVYYGGADTVLCAAKDNLNKFVNDLKISSRVMPKVSALEHTALKFYD